MKHENDWMIQWWLRQPSLGYCLKVTLRGYISDTNRDIETEVNFTLPQNFTLLFWRKRSKCKAFFVIQYYIDLTKQVPYQVHRCLLFIYLICFDSLSTKVWNLKNTNMNIDKRHGMSAFHCDLWISWHMLCK